VTWLAWRQHRYQALLVAAALALAAAALAVQRYAMAAARPGPQWTSWGAIFALVLFEIFAMLLVPVLLGIFLGAPLVARELEGGTHRLAWTQSISRRRWLLVGLAVVLAISLAATAALSAAVSWALAPWVALEQGTGNPGWFSNGTFDVVGVVPVAYALFALALGVASGALVRRTLLAMFVVLVVFTAVRMPVALAARPNYEPPVHLTYPVGVTHLDALYRSGAWTVSMSLVDAGGRPVQTCSGSDCDHARLRVDYQPGDRFWTFQWIEAGIYLGLSALLLGVAYVVVLRRAT